MTLRGVEQPFEVADAHAAGLSNTTYRLVSDVELVAEDGSTLVHARERVTVGRAPGRYHYAYAPDGSFSRQFPAGEREELYPNGSHVHRLIVRGDGRETELLAAAGEQPVAPGQVLHDDPTRR